jgi:hypothetical protein
MLICYDMNASKGGTAIRITVNIPGNLAEDLKRTAVRERVSVSRLTTDAVEYYLMEKRRRTLGKKVLDLAGRARVAPEVLDILEEGRKDERP